MGAKYDALPVEAPAVDYDRALVGITDEGKATNDRCATKWR